MQFNKANNAFFNNKQYLVSALLWGKHDDLVASKKHASPQYVAALLALHRCHCKKYGYFYK
jgi:hypothetical protein